MFTIPQNAPELIQSRVRFEPTHQWLREGGLDYVVIDELEGFQPFFFNLASVDEHWFFCSSYGSLSAGRCSPDTALFPYETVDKIIGNWNKTGPHTALLVNGQAWSPFQAHHPLVSPGRRRLMKSALGDELVFQESLQDQELTFSYRWQLSKRFGFVRRARLSNEGSATCRVSLIDGLQNLLPSGIPHQLQLEYSCLADAYKISELQAGNSLLIHRLAAGIIDQPVPLESLLATTVWTDGLGKGTSHLSREEAEEFLHHHAPPRQKFRRGRSGEFFIAREFHLEPGEDREWLMVAEIEQDQVAIHRLVESLKEPAQLVEELNKDLQQGRDHLREIMASCDGFQETADRDTALYHYQNTLNNILRGGVLENGNTVTREAFLNYLEAHNRSLKNRHCTWIEKLPDTFTRHELLAGTVTQDDPHLVRLAEEYLPLILSRRHGDPSRPWNRFEIRLRDEGGKPRHFFAGNWRDIFQNWEALAWSYPAYLDGFISKFLNASTIDGFNPYRITSEGVDWETPETDNPWAGIGYWGDHQIIYLLKFLELQYRIEPEVLINHLNSQRYVYTDVPYRLRSWGETLKDPSNTVIFDHDRHQELMQRKTETGADGFLLRDEEGEILTASLFEKLLLPTLVKLANLVPGGGIWLNTQRPEWNDANNALAGNGLSLVTAAYLVRYLKRFGEILDHASESHFEVSPALAELLEALRNSLSRCRRDLTSEGRFEIVHASGQALNRYRAQVYRCQKSGVIALEKEAVRNFLTIAGDILSATVRQNQREDGFWHSYQMLTIDCEEERMEVEHLPLMLEGQVAVLSSGLLTSEESLAVLEALPQSELYSQRHRTYLLYPDREPRSFLESNRVSKERVLAIPALASMVAQGDSCVVVPDPACGFRFHSALINACALKQVLEQEEIFEDRHEIEALYEEIFQHRTFTGRSSVMFGYEGLGCVYWHMVSKLMLVAQEVTLQAHAAGVGKDLMERFVRAYYAIQSGLGYRKSAKDYGAFPAEPYSHSPAHAGAQQPGLTGQVKEGILCRLGELGVSFEKGCLIFQPILLRQAEFERVEGTVSFTLAGTPVVYHRDADCHGVRATVQFSSGCTKEFQERLDHNTTKALTQRTGEISRIEVFIPPRQLID